MHYEYYAVYKPYNVLSQFSDNTGRKTLSDVGNFHNSIYPIGRLDYDSEGLLILTNDNFLKSYVQNPINKIQKKYLVQVEGDVSPENIQKIILGVEININGKIYRTKKCECIKLSHSPNVPDRNPPIRYRKSIPTSWLEIILTEGKNRQIRKMTAKVGHPTLRIIRVAIGKLQLTELIPGIIIRFEKKDIYEQLKN